MMMKRLIYADPADVGTVEQMIRVFEKGDFSYLHDKKTRKRNRNVYNVIHDDADALTRHVESLKYAGWLFVIIDDGDRAGREA